MCLRLWDEHFVLAAALLYSLLSATFFSCENPKIKQAEPFVPFKSSQRNSFYNHAIRYFQSHQFAKQCFSNNALVFWHNGRKQRASGRVRLPGWCGDCNVTSPSLRPEDSCGPYRMMNGRLCVQVEQLPAERSCKCSFTTRKIEMGFTYCMFTCSATWNIWCSGECSFLIWRVMIADIMLLKYYGVPKESHSTSTALYWQNFTGSAQFMLENMMKSLM